MNICYIYICDIYIYDIFYTYVDRLDVISIIYIYTLYIMSTLDEQTLRLFNWGPSKY